MPAKPVWLVRVPEILAELSGFPAAVVDRAVIERLFRVRRRRAIQLLAGFGGYQSGKTFLIERDRLMAALRALAAADDFHFEARRREKLGEALEKLRRLHQASRVSIRPPQEVEGLPEGVRLEPGRLTVAFASVEDLLGKLYGIAQAAAADFTRFSAAAKL